MTMMADTHTLLAGHTVLSGFRILHNGELGFQPAGFRVYEHRTGARVSRHRTMPLTY